MSNFLKNIPPVTKNLIIVNVIIWLAMVLFPDRIGYFITNRLGLHYIDATLFNPAQLITYMFVHSTTSFFHILFNMFTLWMFGRVLEQVWGSQRFFIYYMICGMGAGLVQEGVWALVWNHEYISGIAQINAVTYEHAKEAIDAAIAANDPRFLEGIAQFKNTMTVVGASGAIFGLLLGFAFVFPNMPLYLFFIPVPIKAKYMVLGYGVIEFFLGVGGAQSTVAHFAHLGGMLFGLVLLLYWNHKGTLGGNRLSVPKLRLPGFLRKRKAPDAMTGGDFRRPAPGGESRTRDEDERRLNELLGKVRQSGYEALTAEEKKELHDISSRL